MKIVLDDNNYLLVRDTPWDTKAFRYNTSEVLEFCYHDSKMLNELLPLLDKYNLNNNITLVTCRIDADDKLLKKVLQDFSYYYVETSYQMERRHILKQNWGRYGRLLPLEVVSDIEIISQIKKIVCNDFFYGRYHEEVNIDPSLASRRFANWIDELYEQEKEFYIYKSKKGKVIGFHIQEVEGKTAKLILTGCKQGMTMIAIPFFASFLNLLKEREIDRATSFISASNLGAVNLHSHLDYRFTKALFGFNKFYQ